MTDQAKPVDPVLEGGGVKGIGLLGAVLTLVDAGYCFPRVAGTSAGVVVASLIAAYQRDGRDLHGPRRVMDTVDYTQFADGPALERLSGALGEGVEALLHEGTHEHSGRRKDDLHVPNPASRRSSSARSRFSASGRCRVACLAAPIGYTMGGRRAGGRSASAPAEAGEAAARGNREP